MPETPLHQLVAGLLKAHPNEQFTPEEIAKALIEDNRDRFAEKERSLNGRTTILDQVKKEIAAIYKKCIEDNPGITVDRSRKPMRLFYLCDDQPRGISDNSIRTEISAPEQRQNKAIHSHVEQAKVDHPVSKSERSLYLPLQRFLQAEMNAFTKIVNESTSSNKRGKNGNKWLHPDIVGMIAPARSLGSIVKDCFMNLPARRVKLISIEVKLSLSSGNIREAFFQTVSNSLWANRAYLAAAEITGTETLDELNMLCALHGVGYIAVDIDDAIESRVLIPAREREEIDWASANRISEENGDYRAFLVNVLNYLNDKNVVEALWKISD